MDRREQERPSVNDQVSRILANIERRKKELDDDLSNYVLVENRVLSEKMSNVPGLKKHLSHASLTKISYERQEVVDANGHGTVTRADLHRKYNSRF